MLRNRAETEDNAVDWVFGRASREFYNLFIDKVIPSSSIKTAETTKLFENSFRAVNIAFVDAMQMFCNALDIDIWEIIDLAPKSNNLVVIK